MKLQYIEPSPFSPNLTGSVASPFGVQTGLASCDNQTVAITLFISSVVSKSKGQLS